MVKKTQKAGSGSGKGSAITDSRFANFQTDERFRLPNKKLGKTKIDSRFSKLLKDDQFTAAATVDRYGRKIKADSKKQALKKLYEASDDDDDDDDQDEIKDVEVDDDEVIEKELKRANKNYDPARGGGFSSSESDSDSESEEEEEEEESAGEAATKASSSMQRLRDEEAEVQTGEVTSRLAVVNMDWDHVKSQDLMALFSSFVPKGGKIERISVYPSEFGKGRIEREELEGPPKEIFKKTGDSEDEASEDEPEDSDSDEDEDEKIKQDLLKEEDADDFNSDALRKYQLDRLRYYYAVVDCNDKACAESIYQATDGTEYQTTSNFLDLRFIPDGVTFDDEPRDTCTEVPASYRPTEYVTDALQHSKVKLTWDMHPEEASRKEDIKRAFTGSRSDIQENDLRAYLASDSEDSDAVVDGLGADDATQTDEPKLSKKELARKRMREALGLGAEASTKSSNKEPTGEMEMTFTIGDSDGKETKPKSAEEETTVERYMRKERERKAAKKDKAVSKREGAKPAEAAKEDNIEQDGDLGFDDPFFTTEGPVKVSKTSQKKEERLKKRAQKEAEATEDAAEKARLQKLMADESKGAAEHLDHFDMNEIARAEKQKDKKNKKKQKKQKKDAEDRGGLQQDFEMDVTDERFKKVFESHEFAIDPTDPKFQATPGMKKLLQERRKRTTGEEGGSSDRSNKKARRN